MHQWTTPLIVNNTITDSNTSAANSAGGIVLGGSGGINAPVTNTTIRGNIVSMAGPSSQGVIARAGTVAASTLIELNSITAPTAGLAALSLVAGLDVSGNWFGSAIAADVDAAISASGGGTIVAHSYLSSGDDNGAEAGLQLPNTTEMLVPQTAATSGLAEVDGRIQSGIDRAVAGMTVRVAEDTYNESPNINKSLTLVSVSGRDFTAINLQTGPTYLGSLTISGAGNNVTVQGFTINGRDGTPTTIAASNVYLESDLGNVMISANRILVGAIDDTSSNGDDGFGILTTYDEDSDVASLTVTGNIIETLNGTGGRAFYVNPGVDAFTFSNNTVFENFTRTAITQAKDGLVENNTVTGNGSSAGLGTWGFPDATVYGHTTFRANAITQTANAISIFETNDVIVEENFLTNNSTGVRVLDFIGLVTFDATTIRIFNNDLSGNGTLAVSNTTGELVNASGNWYGSTTPGVVALSVSANVDYTPWLGSGTDTLPDEEGFQGDFSTLFVDDTSPQSGMIGRIQEGIDLVTVDGTVNVVAGTYSENLTISKSLSLVGDATTPTLQPAASLPALILLSGATFGGSESVTIDGLNLRRDRWRRERPVWRSCAREHPPERVGDF